MKSSSKQEAVVQMLTRIYLDIRDIEEQYQLLVGEEDFRPRIEYFHDAIRAFTAQDPSRLSLEFLAYDLNCLRYIQAMPLSPFKPRGATLSPRTDLIRLDKGLMPAAQRPDRAVRERLAELYQHYAVLFAALLKPQADGDFNSRIKDLNQDVADISALTEHIKATGEGRASDTELATAINHLEDADLRQALLPLAQQKLFKKKEQVKKTLQQLKERMAKKDKDIAAIESAHMNFALAQLAVFENSKDLLKKMAKSGMNLVGKFVEDSIAATKREMGR